MLGRATRNSSVRINLTENERVEEDVENIQQNSTPERGKAAKAKGPSRWRLPLAVTCHGSPRLFCASIFTRCISQANSLTQAVHFPLHCPPAVNSMGGRQQHSTRHVRQSQLRGSATIREGHGEAYRRKGAGKRRRRGSMREGTLSRGNVLPIVLTSLLHKVDNISVNNYIHISTMIISS